MTTPNTSPETIPFTATGVAEYPAPEVRSDEETLLGILKRVLSEPVQSKVREAVCQCLEAYGRPYVVDTYGNVISNPTPGVKKPFFVGHMDTVHGENKHRGGHTTDTKLTIAEAGNWLMAVWAGPNGTDKISQTGIGGDDKVGVWACLMAAREEAVNGGPVVGLIFPCDEEVGCLGTKHLIANSPGELDDATCFIQLDRRGASDAIEHTNGANIWSPEWCTMLTGIMPTYGYKPCWGTYTDIGEYSKHTGRPAINISSGYYGAHSSSETVNWKEAINAWQFGMAIAKAASERAEPWDAIEPEVVTSTRHYPRQWSSGDATDSSYSSTFPGGPYGKNSGGIYSRGATEYSSYVFIHQFKGWCSIYGSIYRRWRRLFPAAVLDRVGDGEVDTVSFTVEQAEAWLTSYEAEFWGKELRATGGSKTVSKNGKSKKYKEPKGPPYKPFSKRTTPEDIALKIKKALALQLQYPDEDVKVELSPEGVAVYENLEAEIQYDWPAEGEFDATGMAKNHDKRSEDGFSIVRGRAYRASVLGCDGEWFVVSGMLEEWDGINSTLAVAETAAAYASAFLDETRYPVFTRLEGAGIPAAAEGKGTSYPSLEVEVTEVRFAPCWRGTYDAAARGYLAPRQFEVLKSREAVIITRDTIIFAEAYASGHPSNYVQVFVTPALTDPTYSKAIAELSVVLADQLPNHTLDTLT